VAKLLADESDPDLRLQAKRFADELSSRLVLKNRSIADLRQLERLVESALTERRGGADPARPRAAQEKAAPDAAMALAMLGAVLDFPELLEDPAVQDALTAVEGDAALAIAAVRQFLLGGPSRIEDFLAALPGSIQSFATGRLASPQFEVAADARAELLGNSRKLSDLRARREDSRAVSVLERSPSSLDHESASLLRQIEERARRKRGLDV
jgi:DNA primase